MSILSQLDINDIQLKQARAVELIKKELTKAKRLVQKKGFLSVDLGRGSCPTRQCGLCIVKRGDKTELFSDLQEGLERKPGSVWQARFKRGAPSYQGDGNSRLQEDVISVNTFH